MGSGYTLRTPRLCSAGQVMALLRTRTVGAAALWTRMGLTRLFPGQLLPADLVLLLKPYPAPVEVQRCAAVKTGGVVGTLDHSLRSSPLARLYRSQRLCALQPLAR